MTRCILEVNNTNDSYIYDKFMKAFMYSEENVILYRLLIIVAKGFNKMCIVGRALLNNYVDKYIYHLLIPMTCVEKKRTSGKQSRQSSCCGRQISYD